jgi:plastocyanin
MSSRLHWTVPALVALLAGCAGEPAAPPPVNPNAKTVDPAVAGSISGRVTFAGTPPAPEPLRMGTDPACLQGAGSNPVSDAVLVGPDGGLQNAFVYIKDGLDPDYAFTAPTEAAILDQQGCVYTPRVIGVMVGQPLEILNSDNTMHNVHALPMKNIEFNQGQPLKGFRTTHIFTVPEVMVRFTCNVHSWMTSWVGVMPHPYFAVSASDGTFELRGVPPGSYTVEVWTEKFGSKTGTVTIGPKEAGTVSFEFSAS